MKWFLLFNKNMQVNYMGYDQRNEVLDLSKNIKKSIRKYFEDKNIFTEGIDPRYAAYREEDIEDIVGILTQEFLREQVEKQRSGIPHCE
tara:strand:- start:957 stop:1223 length:267 start_codon:yes stop_codon:yes gene_type:complete